jgi:hypothetical protein
MSLMQSCFTSGLSVFYNFIIFEFSSVLMLQSSTSSSFSMILGFLSTSFSLNNFSSGTNSFGMMFFFSCTMPFPLSSPVEGRYYCVQHSSPMFVLANSSLIWRNLSTCLSSSNTCQCLILSGTIDVSDFNFIFSVRKYGDFENRGRGGQCISDLVLLPRDT